MICPACGQDAEFTEHSAEWVETHGLDCGPYERGTATWLTCNQCGSKTDDKELQANQPPEEGCESCHFEQAALRRYPHRLYGFDPAFKKPHIWLCKLCASTDAGTYTQYPKLYNDHERNTLQTMCFVGNAILHEIRKGKSNEDVPL